MNCLDECCAACCRVSGLNGLNNREVQLFRSTDAVITSKRSLWAKMFDVTFSNGVCPLLDRNMCSVYDKRPRVCRQVVTSFISCHAARLKYGFEDDPEVFKRRVKEVDNLLW
jgi:Fe-S-cluster containining protein